MDEKLNAFEQDIENNFEKLKPIDNMQNEMDVIKNSASQHSVRKKSITLRLHESDLEIMRIKASKLGIPYQTYINILIHKDATAAF